MPDVLIADDPLLFRDALQRAVRAAGPDVLAYSAYSVDIVLALIERFHDTELLLLDLHMLGTSGCSALMHIRAQHPGLPIIVVTAHEEPKWRSDIGARRCGLHAAAWDAPASKQYRHRVENGWIVVPTQHVHRQLLWSTVRLAAPSRQSRCRAPSAGAARSGLPTCRSPYLRRWHRTRTATKIAGANWATTVNDSKPDLARWGGPRRGENTRRHQRQP